METLSDAEVLSAMTRVLRTMTGARPAPPRPALPPLPRGISLSYPRSLIRRESQPARAQERAPVPLAQRSLHPRLLQLRGRGQLGG